MDLGGSLCSGTGKAATNGSHLATVRGGAFGHFRSSDRTENRHASDRFQNAAAIARRPLEGPQAPKLSVTACGSGRHQVQALRRQLSQVIWS